MNSSSAGLTSFEIIGILMELLTEAARLLPLMLARNSVIRLVCCDTQVRVVGDLQASRRLNPVKHELRGGGGTDFRPVFHYTRRERKFHQLIYLTDTMGAFPETPPPGLSTPWLAAGRMAHQPPFGEVFALPFSVLET